MDNSNDITVLSLCTGYGGLELGLHRALGRPLRVVAVEIEAFAAANLVAKAEEGKLVIEAMYPDVKTFPAAEFSGCFDFILAGYPCQPFSVAGKRKGEADERHLWPFIRNHIQQIRPVYCFLENVAGHLRLGFDRVVRDLDELGYGVEAGLFTASEVGAPHKRERLFILAHAQHNGLSGRKNTGGFCSSIFGPSQRKNDAGDAARTNKPRKLADTERTGPRPGATTEQAGQGQRGRGPANDGWPARPGQEQYDWEEPRTISNPKRLWEPQQKRSFRNIRRWIIDSGETIERCQEIKGRWHIGQMCLNRNGLREYYQGTTESGMGRTVDGFASRVDELRLLGNGVVPAQAELAFRILYGKMNQA